MEPEGSLPCSQKPSTGPYRARSIQSIPPHPNSLRPILILSSHLCLGLPSDSFPSGLPTDILYAFLFVPIRVSCLAHLILLHLIILIEAPQCVVFPNLPSLHLSSVQIFSSTPCSQTPSVCVPPLMSQTKFHTHTEHRQNYSSVYSNFYVVRQETWIQSLIDGKRRLHLLHLICGICLATKPLVIYSLFCS
jgi:hypothetical protein